MRILGVYNPLSGGSYHRVKLWSEFVENVTLTQELTEELVSQCDILYIHWNSKTSVVDLSIWKEKYGFKLIADIDDVWILPEEFKFSVFLSQHLCQLADHVICTSDYLVPDIMHWNLNITVIPNLVPAGKGQFTPTEKPDRNKIRIGIGGSISHYQDYMSLRPLIRQMEELPNFNNKYEFAVIGYNGKDKRWQDVRKMFKKVKLFNAKSCEDYMSLYDHLDIMFCPLLDTEINRGRSLLKIYECFSKKVVPFLSDVDVVKIPKPEVSYYPYVIRPIWNTKTQLECLESIGLYATYFEQLSYLSTFDYQKECVDSRLELFQKVIDRPIVESKMDLYSIAYLQDQDVEYNKIFNRINTIEDKSYLFEYNKIIEYTNHWETYSNDSYLGYFSYKFPYKTGFYKRIVEDILKNEDSDVVMFCKQADDYLKYTEEQHPGFMNIFTKICDKLGLEIKDKLPTVYSNFFVAKADVYKDYVKLLELAIDIMETDPVIKELCWQDASYKGLSSEDLKKYTGLDHYTFHTFILERLMSVWLVNKNLTYTTYS